MPQEAQTPVPELPPAAPTFDVWLSELRAEATTRGISAAVIEKTLTGVEPVPQILERDQAQAEFVLDLSAYLKRRLTRDTVKTAQSRRTRHATLLTNISGKYDVPPRVLVAVWGLESSFGQFAGVRPTVPTLVTLAYDSRRGPMFRNELFNALQILERGDIAARTVEGLVGRRARSAAVHAVELPALRAGFRRRRPSRHLAVTAGRLRIDRVFPPAARLEERSNVGT